MTITCSVCGTVNPDGTTYCEGCGVELTPAPAAQPAAETTPAAAPVPTTESAPAEAAAPAPAETPAPSSEPAAAPPAPAPETAPAAEATPAPEAAAPETAAPVTETPTPSPEAAPVAAPAPTPAPTPTAGGAAKLGIKKYGAATGEFIPLQGDHLVVGRFDASTGPVDIDLTGMGGQEHISRRHAELYLENGVWHVRDLGSTNGVYVKHKGEAAFSPRLQEPAALADGDEIAFGNLMLTFNQG